MPREFDSNPCVQQLDVMQALGFEHQSTSLLAGSVLWIGHGLSLELREQLELTFATATALVIQAARDLGAEEVRAPIRRALQLPSRASF